jgi:hypothetical protein
VCRALPLQVVSKLHNLLKPFMLRRLKADVEICLPRKQEVLLYAPMSEQQQTINSQLLEKTLGVSGGGLAMVVVLHSGWGGAEHSSWLGTLFVAVHALPA